VVNIRAKDATPDVYIGRAGHGEDGYFGNPFRLHERTTPAAVMANFRAYFYTRVEEDAEFRARVLALRGKRLGCFCKPRQCHGDVIAGWVDWVTEPFKPSQVAITVPPLTGTMDKVEIEVAAALMVSTCAVLEDRWQALSWAQIQGVMSAHRDNAIEPWASMLRNPFIRPDFPKLLAAGYARDAQSTPDSSRRELTVAGLVQLWPWVRP
jgi:hypothetical protein